MFTEAHYKQASELLEILKGRRLKLATAESCTGGMLSALLTEISGSSAVFECGFITYSNESKIKMLGVDAELIEKHGAVSADVASAMARRAIAKTGADIAVSITGIAGPTGGTKEKPVGLVYIAATHKDELECIENLFTGTRQQVRAASVSKALEMLKKII
jgi:nicotinamide-nucleotide amidase